MPVYVYQEIGSNFFKIGRTRNEAGSVAARLRSGNPRPLRLFSQVQAKDLGACEAFFHRMLQAKRVHRGGGTEFFEIEPEQMRSTIARLERVFVELEEHRTRVAELSRGSSHEYEIDPDADDRATLERIRALEQNVRNLEQRKQALETEIDLLKARLKLKIGQAAGMRDIAVWKTRLTRMYDETLFQKRDPDLYDQVMERFHCIDTKRWRREDLSLYKRVQASHFSPRMSRPFKLLGE